MEAIMVCLFRRRIAQLKEVNRRAEIDATGTMCTEGIIKKAMKKAGLSAWMRLQEKMLPYNKEYELKEGKYPEGKMQEIAAGRASFFVQWGMVM